MSDIPKDFDLKDSTLNSSIPVEITSNKQVKSNEFDISLNQESSDSTKITFIDTSAENLSEVFPKNTIIEQPSIPNFPTSQPLRRKIKKNNPLRFFIYNPHNSHVNRYPKIENYWLMIMNLFIKNLRKIYFPRKNRVDYMIVEELKKFAKKHEVYIKRFMEEKNISINRRRSNINLFINRNIRFEIFSDCLIKKAFRIYLHSFFNDDTQSLSKKFKFTCCMENLHCNACEEKWLALEQWTVAGFEDS